MMCRDADKFKALKSCCENVDRVHLVSGTPMRNDSGSIWSLLLLLGVTDGLGCGGFSETEFSRLFSWKTLSAMDTESRLRRMHILRRILRRIGDFLSERELCDFMRTRLPSLRQSHVSLSLDEVSHAKLKRLYFPENKCEKKDFMTLSSLLEDTICDLIVDACARKVIYNWTSRREKTAVLFFRKSYLQKLEKKLNEILDIHSRDFVVGWETLSVRDKSASLSRLRPVRIDGESSDIEQEDAMVRFNDREGAICFMGQLTTACLGIDLTAASCLLMVPTYDHNTFSQS